jgi:GTP:adenosylcobinamide-phosphate guanylyltransferase
MDAVIIAGGIPQPEDPLYEFTKGNPKAHIDIAGKPMIQWVLDALEGAESIETIVIVGLSPEIDFHGSKIKKSIPAKGDMLQNVRSGVEKILELNPSSKHVLIASSDIPSITSEIVEWVVNATSETDEDIYYNLITKEVMEARFPNSKRTFTKLQDVQVCGGDMNVVRALAVTDNEKLYKRIMDSRKNVLKQAAMIGYDTLLLLLLKRITLDGAVKKVTKRLNITGRAILCPYAEVGMDVDKPHQLEILRADLATKIDA